MFSDTRNLFKSIVGGGVVSGLALGLALAGATPAMAQYDDPPTRVARLGHIEGQVSIEPSGVDQWSAASSNYPVATGDRVYSDQDGRGEISAGAVVARMWHSTDVTMTNLTDQLMQLGLAQGTIRLHSYAANQENQIEIDTPNGAVIVTRPGDIRIDVYGGSQDGQGGYQNDGGSVVTVNSGAVQLSGPNLQQDVYAGQSVQLAGSNPIQVSDYEMPNQDEFDSWSLSRDRHSHSSETARYVNRDTVGYDDLDDYGTWSRTSDYGPVWYPREVAADWAPYREGHWVWTGPWGWTWVEDEPWGYAPFHYGRWVRVDDRWGWMPGPVSVRPVWSPALVAFVGGGGFGDDYGYGGDSYGRRSRGGIGISIGNISAWFPLGPGEPYHPWYHASESYQQRVNVTNVNITEIHNTTVVNNYNTYLQNPQDTSRINNVQYANRMVAVTAMRQADFAGARSARSNMVQVNAQQIAQAQIVAHPTIKPTVQSVAPRPVSVPVPVQRPTLLTQGGRQMVAAPGARSQAVPYRPMPVNPGANVGATPGVNAGRGTVGQNPAVNGNQTMVNRGGNVAGPARPVPQGAPGSAQPIQTTGRPTFPVSGRVQPEQQPNYPQRQVGNPQQPMQPRLGDSQRQVGIPQQPQQGQQPNYPQRQVGNPQQSVQPRLGGPQRQTGNPQQGQQPGYPQRQHENPQPQTRPQPAAPYVQPPLVNRNEAPAPRPSFQQQQPGLKQDPGRPLDPRQLQNLNQGRPAGPTRDSEYPPHVQGQPGYQTPARPSPAPQQPAPQPQYRPAPQPQFRPDPQMQNRPVPEPQMRPAPQPQYRPTPQPQFRPDPQMQNRPSPEPQMRPARQPQYRPAPQGKPTPNRAAPKDPKDKDRQPN